jgi:heme A synthase
MVWHPAFSLLAFLLLLFPHGRLPSPRWRPFAWFVVAVYLVLSLAAAVSPGAVTLYYPDLEGPVELPVSGLAEQMFSWLLPGQLLLLVIALVSVVLRLRRASGEERQQVKWFVYTVVTVVVLFVAGILVFGAGVLFPLFGLIPVSWRWPCSSTGCTRSTG